MFITFEEKNNRVEASKKILTCINVELYVLPTTSKTLNPFLDILSTYGQVECRILDKKGDKKEYFITISLDKVIDFDDNELISLNFKNRVMIKLDGNSFLFWHAKEVLRGLVFANNNYWFDLKTTDAYFNLKKYFPNSDIPEYKNPRNIEIQKFQYDLSQFNMLFKSTFLAFNIRSGGATHDLINEIGIVYVENGVINDIYYTELSPPLSRENEFRNKWDDFSPKLSEAWKDIKPYFDKVDYVTAFNLSIHKSNLEKSLKVYNIDLPKKNYFCAYNWAKDVLKKVDKPIFENVCIALNINTNQSNFYQLSRAISVSQMITKIESIAGLSLIEHNSSKPTKVEFLSSFFKEILIESDLSDLTFINDLSISNEYLKGKGIVITGNFNNYPDRTKLEELLKSKGGLIKTGISSKTDIVIIGSDAGPSKLQKIRDLKKSGVQIDLINEQIINNLK